MEIIDTRYRDDEGMYKWVLAIEHHVGPPPVFYTDVFPTSHMHMVIDGEYYYVNRVTLIPGDTALYVDLRSLE